MEYESVFDAFDLYLMGLVDHAEASAFSHAIYELDPVTGGKPDDPGLFHEITFDDLIDALVSRGCRQQRGFDHERCGDAHGDSR